MWRILEYTSVTSYWTSIWVRTSIWVLHIYVGVVHTLPFMYIMYVDFASIIHSSSVHYNFTSFPQKLVDYLSETFYINQLMVFKNSFLFVSIQHQIWPPTFRLVEIWTICTWVSTGPFEMKIQIWLPRDITIYEIWKNLIISHSTNKIKLWMVLKILSSHCSILASNKWT